MPAVRIVGILLVAVLVLALLVGAAHVLDCDHHADDPGAPCHACQFATGGVALLCPDTGVDFVGEPAAAPTASRARADVSGRRPPRAVRPRAPPTADAHG